MTERTPQQQAASIMAATAHLLAGEPHRQNDVADRLAIIVGAPIDNLNLLHWADWVRRSKQNILHVSFREECFPIPTVAMVYVDERDHALIVESCLLWLPQSGGRCWIIPDSDGWGAYRLDSSLTLRRHARPPVRGGKAAEKGHVRAYERLWDIAHEQHASGIELPLPERLQAIAA